MNMSLKRTLLALLLVPAAAMAAPDELTLSPTDNQATAAALVTNLLSSARYHYKPEPLDDALSQDIFDRYLDALDGERMFFLKSDIERFGKYRTELDDALKNRELGAAYEIFNVYLQRVAERTDYARKLLRQPLDFTREEEFRFDREDHPWEPSRAAIEDSWRRRVKNDVLRLKLSGKEMPEIVKTLDKRYASFESRVRELKGDDVFQTLMNAYAGAIEPHTAYMTPRTSENFNISMRLSLEGIGAVLQKDDEHTIIRSIVPGGPAALSGKLAVGDRIVGVAQGETGTFTDVIGWRIDDVVDLIRGPKDTVVRLDILPAEAGLDAPHESVAIVRDKVKLEEQAAKSEVIEIGIGEDARRIGVITLPAFYQDFDARRRDEPDYRSATRDVRRLLAELKAKDVDGVVVDLRNNGGGSLSEAIELTGLFIETGPVVQVRSAGGDVKVESDENPNLAWDGPLAVLVNRASASASEIFAAAIQDYGRGLVIGEPTFGKGTVQNLVDLDMFDRDEEAQLGQLKLTVAQFFRVDGGSTQHKGVVPDIQFPVTLDAEDYGESAYDNALPWTRIRPAGFDSYGNLSALTPLLQARHEARAARDQEFQWWAEDVAEYRKQRDRTTISLVEAERRAERDAEEARRARRKAEREAAGLATDIPPRTADDGLLASERELEEELAREKAEEERPDVLLREAAHILADAVALLTTDKALAARTFPEKYAATGISGSN
jgi:carboxyl-terminal processing protease